MTERAEIMKQAIEAANKDEGIVKARANNSKLVEDNLKKDPDPYPNVYSMGYYIPDNVYDDMRSAFSSSVDTFLDKNAGDFELTAEEQKVISLVLLDPLLLDTLEEGGVEGVIAVGNNPAPRPAPRSSIEEGLITPPMPTSLYKFHIGLGSDSAGQIQPLAELQPIRYEIEHLDPRDFEDHEKISELYQGDDRNYTIEELKALNLSDSDWKIIEETFNLSGQTQPEPQPEPNPQPEPQPQASSEKNAAELPSEVLAEAAKAKATLPQLADNGSDSPDRQSANNPDAASKDIEGRA